MTLVNRAGWPISKSLIRSHLRVFAYFWVMLSVLLIVIGIVVAVVVPQPTGVWQGSRWAPQYFVFVVGLTCAATQLRAYLAVGIARKQFLFGVSVLAVVMALGCTVLIELGFVIERAIFNAQGWSQFGHDRDLVASAGVVAQTAAEFFLLYVSYFLAGLMIGGGFLRLSPAVGVALIIPAALPPLIIESLQWNSGPVNAVIAAPPFHSYSVVITWSLSVLLVIFVALGAIITMRSTPIKTK